MDRKRMSTFVFMAMLFFAAIFDLMGVILFGIAALGNVIPVIGTVVGIGLNFLGNTVSVLFIFFARLSFWLAGYRSKGTTALTVGTALIEMIPGFSILPGCISFVTGFYFINKAASVLEETRIGRLALARVAVEERKRNKNNKKTNEAVLVA